MARGRPRKIKDGRGITVWIPAADAKRLAIIAKQRSVSVSELVRVATAKEYGDR